MVSPPWSTYKEFLKQEGLAISDKLSNASHLQECRQADAVGKRDRDKMMDTRFQPNFQEELKVQWELVAE